jgi:hypothetical protein
MEQGNREKNEQKEHDIKSLLEGDEKISEIKKEEEFSSEIQRDFESIDNALGNKVENEVNRFFFF